MSALAFPRLTPWVGRLIVANAVVLLVLQTVAPALAGWLAFEPSGALTRPWTFVTYMFVHSGLLHLAFNCLFLYFLGTAVEARMGSRAFPLFYLLCGLGGAVFSLALSGLMSVSPFVGASDLHHGATGRKRRSRHLGAPAGESDAHCPIRTGPPRLTPHLANIRRTRATRCRTELSGPPARRLPTARTSREGGCPPPE